LRRQSIVSLSDLVGRLSGESNDENSQDISVGSSDVLDGFNESFSFLDERAELVLGHVDSVEAGEGLSTLGLVDDELDFSPVVTILIGSKIGLHLTDDSASNAVFDFF